MRPRALATLTIAAALTTGCVYDFDQHSTPKTPAADAGSASDTGGSDPLDSGAEDASDSPADMGTPDLDSPDTGALVDAGAPDIGSPEDAGSAMDAGSPQDMGTDMGVVPDPTLCGNMIIDPGELCDPCPSSCDDGNACTMDMVTSGSAATCNLVCDSGPAFNQCVPNDGCCPVGCTLANDSDCTPDCRLDHTWPQAWKDTEAQLHTLVNQRRTQNTICGVTGFPPQPPFTIDARLTQATRCFALDMADRNYFAAQTPEGNGIDFFVNQTTYPWNQLTSTVSNSPDAQAVVDAWFMDEGICTRLMTSSYTQAGVGFVGRSGENLFRVSHVGAAPR